MLILNTQVTQILKILFIVPSINSCTNEAQTLLAFPPEADDPIVQDTIFISFWLKPTPICNFKSPA
jgi:hypothetical protein